MKNLLAATVPKIHLCGPLTSVDPFAFMDPFTFTGPFNSVWPFYTYVGPFTTIWGPVTSVSPPPPRPEGSRVFVGSGDDTKTTRCKPLSTTVECTLNF